MHRYNTGLAVSVNSPSWEIFALLLEVATSYE